MLWEDRHGEPFALELGAELAGAPRIERELADPVTAGERADGVGDLEDRVLAVVDLAADLQRVVDPYDGGR